MMAALQNRAKYPVMLQNLTQNDMFFNSSRLAPSLLQRSMLFDAVSLQEVLPVEHLLIQGFPVPGLVSENLSRHFPFPDIVKLGFADKDSGYLTESELRSITGVGFCWPAIGAFIMMVLCMSEFTENQAETELDDDATTMCESPSPFEPDGLEDEA